MNIQTIQISIEDTLSRMEQLMNTYQTPVASFADGQLSIQYIWISDVAEREYNRLVAQLYTSEMVMKRMDDQ